MYYSPLSFPKFHLFPTDEQRYVRNLNALKGSLKKSFEQAFGEDALLNYYTGKTKTQKFDEDDLALQKGKKPWLETKDFNPHFPHEELADQLKVKFLKLHAFLQPYFMAVAMHEHTGNSAYSDLADDLFIDFAAAAHKNRLPGCRKISQKNLKEVRSEIARAVDVMIEHTLPPKFRTDTPVERHVA